MNILLICDDPLLRDGTESLLQSAIPRCSVITFSQPSEIEDFAIDQDLIVYVASSPAGEDFAWIRSAKRYRQLSVVVVTAGPTNTSSFALVADRVIDRASGGASLVGAVKGLLSLAVGEASAAYGLPKQLTKREREVSQLVGRGMPNRQIAKVMKIKEQSVKNLVSTVMRKVGCRNRVQLTLRLRSPGG